MAISFVTARYLYIPWNIVQEYKEMLFWKGTTILMNLWEIMLREKANLASFYSLKIYKDSKLDDYYLTQKIEYKKTH